MRAAPTRRFPLLRRNSLAAEGRQLTHEDGDALLPQESNTRVDVMGLPPRRSHPWAQRRHGTSMESASTRTLYKKVDNRSI